MVGKKEFFFSRKNINNKKAVSVLLHPHINHITKKNPIGLSNKSQLIIRYHFLSKLVLLVLQSIDSSINIIPNDLRCSRQMSFDS